MKQKVHVIMAAAVVAVALAVAADTLDVPKDETVQLTGDTDYSGTTVAMNGGTLDQNGVTATLAGMTLENNTTNHLVNTGDAASALTIGGQLELSYGMALLVESGNWISAGPTWTIGKWGSATNILEISGDGTRFSVARTDVWYFSDNSPAVVNFRGGQTSFTGDKSLYLASGTSGSLQWNVSGGTHEITDVLNFYRGDVEINVTDGTLKPYYIRMGGADNADVRTHTINQTNGVLEVSREFCLMYSTGSGCNTIVNLDGGVTWAPKLYANRSTRGATSTLTADGGMLRPYYVTSSEFIKGIDNVLLGEQGLTLHVGSYATTIPQDFTGVKPGASYGRLAKKGSATLKLTGAIADGIKVVNEEAALELNGSVGAGEILASAGVVTVNGPVGARATLTVNGGEIVISPDATIDPAVNVSVENGILRVQKDVTVRSLDVGTNGRVVYENGAKLTVPGLTIIVR